MYRPHKKFCTFFFKNVLLIISLQLLVNFLQTPIFALSSDKTKPYQFSTNSIIYDKNSHTLTYLQNAQIQQGTTLLTADKIIVFFAADAQKLVKLIAYGHPAHYSTLPDNKKDKLFAEANIITYDAQKNIVQLHNNAKVTEGQQFFSSDYIWYDIQKEIVHSTAQKNNRTEIIIPPQS